MGHNDDENIIYNYRRMELVLGCHVLDHVLDIDIIIIIIIQTKCFYVDDA